MIDSLILARGLDDDALRRPHYRLALVWCHLHLDWHQHRYLKVSQLARGIRCSMAQAYLALRVLEARGYLDALPIPKRPRYYRLANPCSAGILPGSNSQEA